MNLNKYLKVTRKERLKLDFKKTCFSMFILFVSFFSYSQDSIPAAADFTEEKELKFQQFFFRALSEKSIGNNQKAIENLESCNQILINNNAVFYEFSKNYLALENTLLAKEYIKRAIEKEVGNIWMQKHLVKVLVAERNFKGAIEVQQKVVALNSKERDYLARLYLQNRDYKNALSLMNVLEKEHSLSLNLKRIKNNLENIKPSKSAPRKVETDVYKQFETDKSYAVLAEILKDAKGKPTQLLKYSAEGISLFPAQPLVYLINGRVLNTNKNYKKALVILKNGIDFVIEDAMEADFYKEMALSYKGLGNKIDEKKYTEKYNKLKK